MFTRPQRQLLRWATDPSPIYTHYWLEAAEHGPHTRIFTLLQVSVFSIPAVSSSCLAGMFCVGKHKHWAPFNTAELTFLYRRFIDKELQFNQETFAFTSQQIFYITLNIYYFLKCNLNLFV